MTKQGYTELTLDLLEKSPEAGNLLVQLHDKHKLYSLAKNRDSSARAELADIMSDLLNLGLKPPENELVTDVLMTLIRQAENDLKQAVAERLSAMHDVPLRLAVHLANEKIEIADSMLRFCEALNDMDLIYIIKSQTAEHWQAIAKRQKMSDQLINALADTEDLDTAVNLSENDNVRLTGHAMTIFSVMAEESEVLAKPLLAREELPGKLATRLYEFVGSELKNYIKDNFDIGDVEKTDTVVDDIVFELTNTEDSEYSPTAKMISAAESMLDKGFLTTTVMIENLKRGQISNFVAQFSVYCGLPINVVSDMLQQSTAQGLAIACKAIGIMKPEFVNIFLLTSRIRGGRVIDQKDFARALAYYDKVSEEAALRILNQSRH